MPAVTVTAQAGGSTANGILLHVECLDSATLAGSPQTAVQSGAAAHQAPITPSADNSVIYGAIFDGFNGTVPWDPGCNGIDNVTDPANGCCYATFDYDTSGTGAGTPVTVGSAASFNGGLAAIEVVPSGGTISSDASSPPVASTTTADNTSTGSFTPPAGKLLVAMVVANGGAGVTTMEVTGGGLTWTERVAAHNAGEQYAGIWTATAAAAGETQYAMAVPYAWPVGSQFWDDLIANGPAPVKIVVANVDSGPGTGYESVFGTVYTQCAEAGITVVGYVSTNGAAASLASVEAQIDQWHSFYGEIGGRAVMGGILFDLCACTTGNVTYYTDLVDYIHDTYPGWIAVLNPGDIPAETYVSTPIGDIIQVCEDSYADFPADATAAPGWLADYPASRIAVTCNTCPTQADMDNVVALAASAFNAKYVWATQDGDYVDEPSYFAAMMTLLKGSGGGGGGGTTGAPGMFMAMLC